MTDIEVAVQMLQIQRNTANDALVNMAIEKQKLESKIVELQAELAAFKTPVEIGHDE